MTPRPRAGGATRVTDTTNTVAGDPARETGLVASTPTAAATTGHEPAATGSIEQEVGPGRMSVHQQAQDSALEKHRNQSEAGEQVGVYQRHQWMVPATVILAIIGAFGIMILLTWLGGTTPFQ